MRFGIAPPNNVVPHADKGTLVPPERRAAAIPAIAYEGWPKLPAQFTPQAMNANIVLGAVDGDQHLADLGLADARLTFKQQRPFEKVHQPQAANRQPAASCFDFGILR